MTLQALHGFSDRETAEAVRFDLRWKLACGLSLDDPGIHPTSLVVWRRRIAGSARPYRLNEAVRQVVQATGIVKGRRRVADSTILADAVASQDTVTQLIAAMRRVLRQVPGAAGVIAAACTGFDYGKGRPAGGRLERPAGRAGAGVRAGQRREHGGGRAAGRRAGGRPGRGAGAAGRDRRAGRGAR